MIKKIKKFIFLTLIFYPINTLAAKPKLGENKDTSALFFIVRIINFILEFVMALAVLYIVIGGLQYMTSQGNEDKIKLAKKTLTYAIIGLIIILTSLATVNFVQNTLIKVVE